MNKKNQNKQTNKQKKKHTKKNKQKKNQPTNERFAFHKCRICKLRISYADAELNPAR